MDKSFSIPEFPMRAFEVELKQDHAEFKAALEEASKQLLTQLKTQQPQLTSAEITKYYEINISIVLSRGSLKGVLLEYLEKGQSCVYKQICSQIEDVVGQPVTPRDLKGLLTICLSEIDKIDQADYEYSTKVAKGMQRIYLAMIDKMIPREQTIRPDIKISIYLPNPHGAQISIYAESKGTVLKDDILKLPTVTLDTNVVRELWDERLRAEHVKKLLRLGEAREIDLAVTRRIQDDIPRPPLANKINDLPTLNIHEIGAVVRWDCWKVGIDTAGVDEFKQTLDSLESSKKFNDMNEDKRPDWRDWDHVHTHYRYSRDYFLTWDKKILCFKNEFRKGLGIEVMKPEEYLARHHPKVTE